jgi:hypothetical protein
MSWYTGIFYPNIGCFFYTTNRTCLYTIQHTSRQTDASLLLAIVKMINTLTKNRNIYCLISTKLSEIVESSVQQLIYKTVSTITTPMQTKRTSIHYAPGTPITRPIRHQIWEDLTPAFRIRISTKVQKLLSIVIIGHQQKHARN